MLKDEKSPKIKAERSINSGYNDKPDGETIIPTWLRLIMEKAEYPKAFAANADAVRAEASRSIAGGKISIK